MHRLDPLNISTFEEHWIMSVGAFASASPESLSTAS